MSTERTFKAVAINANPLPVKDNSGSPTISERQQVEFFYLGTNHGIYEIYAESEGGRSRVGITNGALLGKRIEALTTHGDIIYAGTHKRVIQIL